MHNVHTQMGVCMLPCAVSLSLTSYCRTCYRQREQDGISIWLQERPVHKSATYKITRRCVHTRTTFCAWKARKILYAEFEYRQKQRWTCLLVFNSVNPTNDHEIHFNYCRKVRADMPFTVSYLQVLLRTVRVHCREQGGTSPARHNTERFFL